ncbi:MAG TPA: MFS transporter [Castellaniella sp.]|nr:MFS transporter [Castellaniella sp.]
MREGTHKLPLHALLLIAVLLSAVNMRGFLTSMGPVLDEIRNGLGLSAGVTGVMIALPTLYFGVFSLAVPRLLQRWSVRPLLMGAMLVAAAGVAVRSLLGTPGMFVGLLATSAGVSVAMVIVPAIIKSAWPQRQGLYTSLYTMMFCLGASSGAALSVPLARLPHSSWHWSLAVWMLPALAAALMWRVVGEQAFANVRPPTGTREPVRGLYRDALAWQVALFMGLQASVGQTLAAWMPLILIDRGLGAAEAGAALSLAMLSQVVTNLAAPWIATRMRDQRLLITLMMAALLVGLLGVFLGPLSQVWMWIVVLGLGMGGIFAVAVSLLVLRSRTPREAAALSGMAQGVGYTVAALGPAVVGVLREFSSGWTSTAMFFVGLCVTGWLVGLGAGRNAYILPEAATPDASSKN